MAKYNLDEILSVSNSNKKKKRYDLDEIMNMSKQGTATENKTPVMKTTTSSANTITDSLMNDKTVQGFQKALNNKNLSSTQRLSIEKALENYKQNGNTTIAPSKQILDELTEQGGKLKKANTKETDNLFNVGGFYDGYQFGDVSKTIGASIADPLLGFIKQPIETGENITDSAWLGVAQVGDLIGADDWANRQREKIANKERTCSFELNRERTKKYR